MNVFGARAAARVKALQANLQRYDRLPDTLLTDRERAAIKKSSLEDQRELEREFEQAAEVARASEYTVHRAPIH